MLALALALPVILLPVLFVWYVNVGGMYSALKKAWSKRARQITLTKEIEIDRKWRVA